MPRKTQSLVNYETLGVTDRRLADKLIAALKSNKLDKNDAAVVRRAINRSGKDKLNAKHKYANGYTVFFMDRLAELKAESAGTGAGGISVTDAGKQIGLEWKSLSDEAKDPYKARATTMREASKA